MTFNPPQEEWPLAVSDIYLALPSKLQIIVPDNPLLQTVLGGFVPPILVGILSSDGGVQMVIGQDRNGNQTPDVGTALTLDVSRGEMGIEGRADTYAIEVRDAGDMSIGTLILKKPRFIFSKDESTGIVNLNLIARVKTSNMTAIVAPFGIEEDALGELLKDVWGIEAEEELPIELPMQVNFELDAIIN